MEETVVFLTLKVFNSDNFSIGSYYDELGQCHLGIEGNQGAETSCVCVCTKRVCVKIAVLSAKQCDWLSHVRPAPFPFPLFLFPVGELLITLTVLKFMKNCHEA